MLLQWDQQFQERAGSIFASLEKETEAAAEGSGCYSPAEPWPFIYPMRTLLNHEASDFESLMCQAVFKGTQMLIIVPYI